MDVTTEQVGARLSWFLAGVYAGGAKRKRIARDFEVSPETAKGWLNGNRPGSRHFDAMVKMWGREFLSFVYPATAEQRAVELKELREIAVRVARIEERIDAPMVGRDSTGLASPEGAAPVPHGGSARQGARETGHGGSGA